MTEELQRKLCSFPNYGTECATLEGSQQLVLALDRIPFPGRKSLRFHQENDPRPEFHRHAVLDSGHMVGYIQKDTNTIAERYRGKGRKRLWVFCPDLCQYLQIPHHEDAVGIQLSATREVIRIRLQQRPMKSVRHTYNGLVGFCNGILSDEEGKRRVQLAWKDLDPATIPRYRRVA